MVLLSLLIVNIICHCYYISTSIAVTLTSLDATIPVTQTSFRLGGWGGVGPKTLSPNCISPGNCIMMVLGFRV